MKTKIEYSSTGGFRFNHLEPIPVGKHFMHLGHRVKLVGEGMAGMPEVQNEDGSTVLAMPRDLIEIP